MIELFQHDLGTLELAYFLIWVMLHVFVHTYVPML